MSEADSRTARIDVILLLQSLSNGVERLAATPKSPIAPEAKRSDWIDTVEDS